MPFPTAGRTRLGQSTCIRTWIRTTPISSSIFKAPATADNYGWIFYDASNKGPGSPTNVIVPCMVCPSDGLGGKWNHSPFGLADFAKGNYAGFFGNLDLGATLRPKSPANLDAVFNCYNSVTASQIRDGLSNTMAFGEMLTGIDVDNDARGVFWYDSGFGCSQIFTKFPPNTPSPDVRYRLLVHRGAATRATRPT